MLEAFSVQAREVLTRAEQEALAFGHDYLGTEHLLLGLIGHRDDVAAQVLESLRVRRSHVESEVERIIGRGEVRPREDIPLTPAAEEAVERSLREARAMGQEEVAGQHLLLGLSDGEGLAARILRGLDISVEQVRRELKRLLLARHPPDQPSRP